MPDKLTLESKVFITCLDNNKFIRTTVRPGALIELEDAMKNTEMVLAVSDNKRYPILVDLRKLESISKEARDYFSMRGREPQVTAIAMLIESPVSRIIGMFFLGLNKPVVPTQLFTSEAKALKWLSNFINGD